MRAVHKSEIVDVPEKYRSIMPSPDMGGDRSKGVQLVTIDITCYNGGEKGHLQADGPNRPLTTEPV